MSSAQYLFDRQWSVTLGIGGSIVDVQGSGSAPKTQQLGGQSIGFEYTGLRTTFDIIKTSTANSQKAKIEIYNLSEASRQQFQKGTQLWMQAGYQGLMKTLYVGDALPNGIRARRDGADIVSTFECGAFEKNLAFSYFHKSYPAGTKRTQIIADLVQAMGASIGTIINLPEMVYQSGYHCAGSVQYNLNEILKGMNMNWHIDSNTLNIWPKGQHLGEEAIVVSGDPKNPTGLIGVPSQGDDFVEFTSLLNPEIAPGRLVQLVSKTINGYYCVRQAHYEGDSHGDKWQVTVQGVKVNATQKSVINIRSAGAGLVVNS